MYIQEPMENLQTLQYKDIILVIDEFYRKHIQQTVRNFAFVSGDQQTWIKLMILRQKNQNKYNWMIPIPGEWHWTWHIIKGIFRMFYDSILHPFAKVLGFKSLDKKADNFHYAEDLLEMVTLSVFKWMEKAMENIPTGQSIVEWMHTIKDHRNAYELAYACYYYFVPYWVTRSALKWNKFEDMKDLYRWWVHLFIATNKRNYVILSLKTLWVFECLNDTIKNIYDQYRVFSFSGDEGTGIAWDGLIEIVSIFANIMQIH